MKRLLSIILLLLSLSTLSAEQRSESIVFINGQRYYVHSVASGETLYSLSKLYGVSTADITDSNASVKEEGLKSGENIKVPIKAEAVSTKGLDKKQRKSFDTHKVSRGETLYAISRLYAISVATIVEDNPSIDPSRLALGQEVLIRKKEIGRSSESQTIEELGEYTSQMSKVSPKGYEYYAVPPRQTLYSLLQISEMTRKEFMEINENHSGELHAGEIVLIRSSQQEETVEQSEDNISLSRYTTDEVHFTALRYRDTLTISLLLPLSNKSGSVMPLFKEFYEGFLLGVEELKEQGRKVEVNLFDTKRDVQTLRRAVASEEFKRSDLIVGPVYEELLDEVLPFAQSKMIPVVSPLATLKSSPSGVLFQMAPATGHRYDKIGELLTDSTRITLIYSENIDTQYEAQVKELLGQREYTTHTYEYEHPSAIADRVREARRLNLEDELEPSPSDLSPLIEGDTLTTIFILADNETDVDRILSALASAEIGLRSRTQRVCDFRVVGNPQWSRYTNIDRAMLFRARVTTFSSYHARRDGEIIRKFDSRYVESFGALPSLSSYRGYDTARIFGEGLYSDIEYAMQGRTFTPLQSTYRFQRVHNDQGRVNQNWIKVNYLPNFTITIE